ncbi:MAG: hypothetical protein WC188_04700 [Candidatus Caldatribacteriota bacterium]|nr:hypothetical protein [Patescibacteria group bacterium]
MNTNVHESGRATLPTDDEIVKFFEDHLTDVKTITQPDNKEITVLKFNTNEFPDKLILPQNNPLIYGLTNINDTELTYLEDQWNIKNKDVISVVDNVKKILRQGKVSSPVVNYYIELMTAILEVGKIYSSFVEILFANMFIVDYNAKKFWRYNQHIDPVFKLGDKMMAAYISSRIGLLFQPNKKTVERVNLEELDTIDVDNLTIYEKIYLGRI